MRSRPLARARLPVICTPVQAPPRAAGTPSPFSRWAISRPVMPAA
ncbi:MAG: hypothetical protein Q7J28_15560 [Caulobacter sp.]|nr:hypothetical protein [Caulobacter sp.]